MHDMTFTLRSAPPVCSSTVRLHDVRDADVRPVLARKIAQRMGHREHVLVPEVELRWSVPARVDALLVSDRLCGFEIKSDVDSLDRLPRQVLAYNMVLERATLVVGERHRLHASDVVPSWWSIWVASARREYVTITQVRGGRLNPTLDTLAVTSLLTRTELLQVSRDNGLPGASRMGAEEVRSTVVGGLNPRQVVSEVRRMLLAREGWRSRSLAPA